MGQIHFLDTDEVDAITRFLRDDGSTAEKRIHFIQANFNQNLMVEVADALPYHIYTHDPNAIREVIEKLVEITGLDIPEGYYKGTTVYNVRGLLRHYGLQVDFRVSRQQIFLGGSTRVRSVNDTESILFHCIGNTLWNYIDSNLWAGNLDAKNEYRDIRGLKIYKGFNPSRANDKKNSNKHQDNLFYIAAEDFRYLFGTPMAGRGEWHLNSGPNPVAPPTPDVIAFWRREVSRNGSRPQTTITSALGAEVTEASAAIS